MKKLKQYLKISSVIAISITTPYLVYTSYKKIFTPSSYQLHFPTSLSSNSREKIDSFIAKNSNYQQNKPAKIISTIKENFPFIKTVALNYEATKQLDIIVSTYKPIYLINSNQLLLESGELNSREDYTSEVTQNLPTINFNNKDKQQEKRKLTESSILQQIDHEIKKQYSIVWKNENHILLNDKNQKNFSILCNAHSILQKNKITTCQKLKNKKIARNRWYLTKRQVIADIRFDKQIIFSRGGKGHDYTKIT